MINDFEGDSDGNSLENNTPTMEVSEVRELVRTLLLELSGSEISYTPQVAAIESDTIVDDWLEGNNINLF